METSIARADFDDWGDDLNYAWYPKVFAKLLQNKKTKNKVENLTDTSVARADFDD